MSTNWTQAEYDTLKAAIASGVLTVVFDGPPRRQVTYQSLAEMRSLLSEMRQDLSVQAGGARYTLLGSRKGV